ncbi:MAG: hypothetical protein PHI53_01905 [Candidatus Pacebacteria bacterium]|nr:hypothetical protein [Candidatus Paceibacterota bacterium]
MRFSEAPCHRYFVVINPDSEMPLLCKTGDGKVVDFSGYEEKEGIEIKPDAEIQLVRVHSQR